MTISTAQVLLRLAAAALLGGLVGFERERRGQAAGLRTHLLVALGSALFTMAGAYAVTTDPTRVAAQVVTGVGFLGAGAILRRGTAVHGLTTAATIWVAASLGMAAGFGYWAGAIGAGAITLVALVLLKLVERMLFGRTARHDGLLVVETTEEVSTTTLTEVLHERHVRVAQIDAVAESESGAHEMEIAVKSGDDLDPMELTNALAALPGVIRVTWRR